MIATVMLSTIVASLVFVVAAYCAERGLNAARQPTRLPWVIASLACASIPLAQLVALTVAPTTTTSLAQQLPLTTILTGGVVERLGGSTVADLSSWLITLWLCASFALCVRIVRSSRALRRVARSWQSGRVAGVDTWISDSHGPAVVGLEDPEIVLPDRVASLSLDEQRLAIAHELQHIAAKDHWLVRGAACVQAAVPWNPLVWVATGRLRSAVEIDCDARVLRETPNVSAYAALVLQVASWPRELPAAAPALGETAVAQLERRIRLMTSEGRSRRLIPAVFLLIGALALGAYGCEVAVSVERPNAPERARPNEVLVLPRVETTATESAKAYFEFQVDKPVTVADGSAAPRYPQILRQAGVEGELLVQFVVDEHGRADPTTFQALKTSHDLFTASVFEALPGMHFVPAEINGRKVRQLVQQPFVFAIQR